ncbi:MAG: type II secretion system F family protein [Gemmataceae bacterium]
MTNRQLIFFLAGISSVIGAGAFLLLRMLVQKSEERMHRRLNGHEEDPGGSGVLVRRAKAKQNQSQWARAWERFSNMIHRTGLEFTGAEAMGLMVLLGSGLALVFFLLRGEVWLASVGLVLGMVAPFCVFLLLQSRHRHRMQQQLPDAFSLLSRSLRAGLSLDQAIKTVGTHGNKPLADEFAHCAVQLSLGLSVRYALEITAERIRLLDFNTFVSTVTLYLKTGGNLAKQLDRLADVAQSRNQYIGYVQSATSLARISSFALAVVGPGLLLSYLLFRPDHVTLFFQSWFGWVVVGVALLLECLGLVWVYFMTRVPY